MIKVIFLDMDDNGQDTFETTKDEIKSTFEVAKKIPDSWTKIDIGKLAENISQNCRKIA